MNELDTPYAASPDKLSTGIGEQPDVGLVNRIPAMSPAPVQPKTDIKRADDVMISELAKAASPQKVRDDASSQISSLAAGKPIDSFNREGPEVSDFGLRYQAALARNLKEGVGFWEKVYNKKPGDDNVRVMNDGEIWYRKHSSEQFRPVDDNTSFTMADFADMIPALGSIANDVTVETAATAAGAGLGGALSGGNPLGFQAGAMAGAFVGRTIAPAASYMYQKKAAEEAGVPIDEQVNIIEQAAPQALISNTMAAVPMAYNALKKGFSALHLSNFDDIATLGYLKKAAQDAAESFGFKGRPAKEVSNEIASKGGLLDQKLDAFGKTIGLYKQEALTRANYAPVQINRALSTMEDILTEQGAKINPDTGLMVMPDASISVRGQIMQPDKTAAAGVGGYFGDKSGASHLQVMIDDYNTLVSAQRSGGVNFDRLDAIKDKYEAMSKFDQMNPRSDNLLGSYRKIQNSIGADRNDYMMKALKGSQYEGQVKEAFANYSSAAEDVYALRNMFEKVGSAEKFVEAIAKPENSDKILSLKNALGPNSKEFNEFVGTFLDKKIQENVDSVDGFLDSRSLYESLKAMGQESLDAMGIDKSYMGKFVVAAREFQKVNIQALKTKSQSFDGTLNLIRLMVGGQFSQSQAKLQTIYQMTRRNANLADWLADEGFLKVASTMKSEKDKKAVMELSFRFKDLLTNSAKVPMKRTQYGVTNYSYIPLNVPVVREVLGESIYRTGEKIPAAIEKTLFDREIKSRQLERVKRDRPGIVVDEM